MQYKKGRHLQRSVSGGPGLHPGGTGPFGKGHPGFSEARKNFKEVSEENSQPERSGHIESAREKLEEDSRQSFSLNELKVIYIGLNFLRDDLGAPAEQRSEKNRGLTDRQVMDKKQDVRNAHQKITAVFTRMGVDIQATLRGF